MDLLKQQHDELLANKPDALSEADYAQALDNHKANCPFCNPAETAEESHEGGDMEKEFTKDDLDAAVTAALAPLQAELESLQSQVAEGEVDDRVAAAKADGDARVAAIQAELDEAVNAKGAAEVKLEEFTAWLAGEAETQEVAQWVEAVKAERRTALLENSNLDEAYVDEHIDRWVAMEAEVFEAVVDGFKSTKVATPAGEEGKSEEAKLETAMNNTRVDNSEGSIREDLKNLLGASTAGYNVKRI